MSWQISEEANSFLAANMPLYFIVVYCLNVDNALCSACGKMIYGWYIYHGQTRAFTENMSLNVSLWQHLSGF